MSVKIRIRLKGNQSYGNFPLCRIELNSTLIGKGPIVNEQILEFSSELNDQNILRITHYSKSNRDTKVNDDGNIVEDRSLEILGINIGGVEILGTVLNMQKFYVEWPENIIRDYEQRNEFPPKYLTNNLYLGFNGTYEFKFTGNPEKLRYEQLWLDEEQAHLNQTIIKDGKEIFDGLIGDSDINKEFDLTIYDLEKLINA